MSFFSKVKSKASGAVNALKRAIAPAPKQSVAPVASVAPRQTLAPNISTPQGIGQTQSNGSVTLLNKQGVATGSVINNKGVGSTPMPSQPSSPYYAPPAPQALPDFPAPPSSNGPRPLSFGGSSSTQTSTPATTSGSGGALDALSRLANTPIDQSKMPATALSAYQQATQSNQTPATPPAQSAVASIDPGAGAGAAVDVGGVQPNIKSNFYQIIDKSADSATQRSQLDQGRQQEDALRQNSAQSIKAKIAELTAQRDAMIAAGDQTPVDRTQLDTFGLDTPYKPDSQPAVSHISAQLDALEKELLSLMQDSPEYTAAKEALNAKEAEEAAIKSRLTKGVANIEEQPIAYSFLSGQSAALKNQANADLQTNYAGQIPLQQRLATEQAKKQSSIDVVKTKYGNLDKERNRMEDTYKTNYGRSNTLADREAEQRNKLALAAAKPTKTSSQSNYTSSANITALKNKLKQSSYEGAEADGKYADPNIYLANYNSYPDKAEFLRLFPPATYINPANNFLPREIMQFVKQGGRSA